MSGIKEQLRLTGITDSVELSNLEWQIKNVISSQDVENKKARAMKELMEAVQEYDVYDGMINIGKIRKASHIIESLMVLPETPTLRVLEEIEKLQNDPNARQYQYKLQKFPTLMKSTCGLQKGFYIITADPNVGKTAFLCQLTNDLLASNDGNSVKVLFFSLDDDKDDIFKRLISNLGNVFAGNREDTPNINASSSYYDFYDEVMGKWQVNPKSTQAKRMATKVLRENIEAGRLEISDKAQSLESMRTKIVDYGTENLVVMVDAVYRMKVNATGNEKDDVISSGIKDLAKDFKIPIVCVKELNKDKDRKTAKMSDIKGSQSWGYNASFVASLTAMEDGTIKMWIDKTKKSNVKGRPIFYNFYPDINLYQEIAGDY